MVLVKNMSTLKKNIMKNQLDSDYLILNFNQEESIKLAEVSKATVIPFSTDTYLDNGASIKDGVIYFQGQEVIDYSKVVLPGKFNLENILAQYSLCKISRCL